MAFMASSRFCQSLMETGHLHYSSVISISNDVANVIRENLLKSIEDNKRLIKSSSEEKLYSYCLDFFEI